MSNDDFHVYKANMNREAWSVHKHHRKIEAKGEKKFWNVISNVNTKQSMQMDCYDKSCDFVWSVRTLRKILKS